MCEDLSLSADVSDTGVYLLPRAKVVKVWGGELCRVGKEAERLTMGKPKPKCTQGECWQALYTSIPRDGSLALR